MKLCVYVGKSEMYICNQKKSVHMFSLHEGLKSLSKTKGKPRKETSIWYNSSLYKPPISIGRLPHGFTVRRFCHFSLRIYYSLYFVYNGEVKKKIKVKTEKCVCWWWNLCSIGFKFVQIEITSCNLQSEKSSRIYSSTTMKQSVPRRLSTYFIVREVRFLICWYSVSQSTAHFDPRIRKHIWM